MNHDPTAWAWLGAAIRNDRESQGLTREELVARVVARGGKITARTIASMERGAVPKKGVKPPSVERVVAALGWRTGWADRILNGQSAAEVLGERGPRAHVAPTARERALELVPTVYEFSRVAQEAGGDGGLRNEFDRLAHRLLVSIPVGAGVPARSAYGLVAYRPHAPGEGVPVDDRRRIDEAMRGNG